MRSPALDDSSRPGDGVDDPGRRARCRKAVEELLGLEHDAEVQGEADQRHQTRVSWPRSQAAAQHGQPRGDHHAEQRGADVIVAYEELAEREEGDQEQPPKARRARASDPTPLLPYELAPTSTRPPPATRPDPARSCALRSGRAAEHLLGADPHASQRVFGAFAPKRCEGKLITVTAGSGAGIASARRRPRATWSPPPAPGRPPRSAWASSSVNRMSSRSSADDVPRSSTAGRDSGGNGRAPCSRRNPGSEADVRRQA